jgi:hypothetical protein
VSKSDNLALKAENLLSHDHTYPERNIRKTLGLNVVMLKPPAKSDKAAKSLLKWGILAPCLKH